MNCLIAEQKTNDRFFCIRENGHDGPCAAVPKLTQEEWQDAQLNYAWVSIGLLGRRLWQSKIDRACALRNILMPGIKLSDRFYWIVVAFPKLARIFNFIYWKIK